MSRSWAWLVYAAILVTATALTAKENPVKRALQRTSAEPVKIYYDGKLGTPQFIRGSFAFPSASTKAEVARAFLRQHGEVLGIPPSHRFQLLKTLPDGDNTVVRLTQEVNGVPIFGSDVAFHITPDNRIRVIAGKLYTFDVDPRPELSTAEAIGIVEADLRQRGSTITGEFTTGLTAYVRHRAGVLSWHVTVATVEADQLPGEWHYFVDARSGKIVSRFNNVQVIRNRETYDGNNSIALPGTLIITEGGSSPDAIAQTTHDHTGTTYDYFFNTHGRDSFDDAGATIRSTVHHRINYVNAFWNGNQLVYGDGDGVQSDPLGMALDVVAHEFTHAVTTHTANLIYQDQSGALNESMSDIFAALIDAGDFMIGEDVWTPGTPGDALRYIDNPPLGGQPDHMSGYIITTGDNGGVHTNSGIPNKAFYNIVTAIGRPATGQIYYRGLTVYMTASTDFQAARLALIQAAEDLFGVGSAEAAAVEAGFDAVGISPPPPDFTGIFVSDPFSTPHPYENNSTYSVTYTHPGALRMKVRFTAFDTENAFDVVSIKDGNGNVIYRYDGNLGPFTTGPVPGETITVELTTDFVATRYGFDIDGYFYDDGSAPDVTPPVISGVSAIGITANSATISWTTDELSDSRVEYGLTAAYGNATPLNPTLVTNHSMNLSGLTPGTTYHFRVLSADAAGNQATSGDFTFTTAPPATDVVTITKAQYKNGKGELNIEARCSDPTATLTVVGIGVMDGDGKGRYRFRRKDVFPNPGSITVVSSGGGSDTRTLLVGPTLTGVPEETRLYPNSPNPFNPTTSIRYSLRAAGEVHLTLFTVTGQKVMTLVEGYQRQGEHTLRLDARHLPSGIYLLHLKADHQVFTRRIVLLK
ncbi:MAG: T9SS C-terminal target domain-containing protein [Calditrichaeota bacterium]|nr:MAG: T9SS C-terminal target domain-containing protein [Calditrichota bacterium]